MNLSEVRKFLVAAAGGIVAIIPQILATFGGVIPDQTAAILTSVVAVATAILVYLVPNGQGVVADTVDALDALEPVAEVIRAELAKSREQQAAAVHEQVRAEVTAQLPQQPVAQQIPVTDHVPTPLKFPLDPDALELIETAQQRIDEVQTDMQHTLHAARTDFAGYIGQHRAKS